MQYTSYIGSFSMDIYIYIYQNMRIAFVGQLGMAYFKAYVKFHDQWTSLKQIESMPLTLFDCHQSVWEA